MKTSYPLFVSSVRGSTKGEPLKVYSPFDRRQISLVETCNEESAEQALSTASRLHEDQDNWLPLVKRIDILEKAAQIIKTRSEELAMDAAEEGGKPLVDSRVEIARAIDCLRICVETMRTQAGEKIPMNTNLASQNRMAFTNPEPIGVVLAISAFNHPFNLIAHQVAPAIATGCPVLVKPAEDTPISCLNFVEILYEAGLPQEWCQVVPVSDISIAGKMVRDPRIAFLTFIGSAKVGWMLRSQLSPGTRCALEHGGAAPVIFAEDASLGESLPLLLKGGFYHAGQVCVSVQRVFAHEKIADRFAEMLSEGAQALIVGDPTNPKTEAGPLIRPGEVDRVHEWIKEAQEEGAKTLCGGDKISETCYAPTVLLNPSFESRVSRQEIFGPVINIYTYKNIDEAIQRANDLPYAFQASVFSHNSETIWRAYKRLKAAAVMVNDHTAFRVDWMPFAGLKESGLGIGGIPYTIRDMQVEKLMVWKSKEL